MVHFRFTMVTPGLNKNVDVRQLNKKSVVNFLKRKVVLLKTVFMRMSCVMYQDKLNKSSSITQGIAFTC